MSGNGIEGSVVEVRQVIVLTFSDGNKQSDSGARGSARYALRSRAPGKATALHAWFDDGEPIIVSLAEFAPIEPPDLSAHE
jgi:hypothetical protein